MQETGDTVAEGRSENQVCSYFENIYRELSIWQGVTNSVLRKEGGSKSLKLIIEGNDLNSTNITLPIYCFSWIKPPVTSCPTSFSFCCQISYWYFWPFQGLFSFPGGSHICRVYVIVSPLFSHCWCFQSANKEPRKVKRKTANNSSQSIKYGWLHFCGLGNLTA